MPTMHVSLPEDLKAFVDRQVEGGGYGSTSEFVRDLIRRERDRQQLRNLLFDGAASTLGPLADATCFASLREHVHSGS